MFLLLNLNHLSRVSLILEDVLTLSDRTQMFLVLSIVFAYSTGKLSLNCIRAISRCQLSGVLGMNTYDLSNTSCFGGVFGVVYKYKILKEK